VQREKNEGGEGAVVKKQGSVARRLLRVGMSTQLILSHLCCYEVNPSLLFILPPPEKCS
jgi:hypothetical protein